MIIGVNLNLKVVKDFCELAWWTGKLHEEREQEKKYVFNEKGNQRQPSAVEPVAGFRRLVLEANSGRASSDGDKRGRRPCGSTSFRSERG